MSRHFAAVRRPMSLRSTCGLRPCRLGRCEPTCRRGSKPWCCGRSRKILGGGIRRRTRCAPRCWAQWTAVRWRRSGSRPRLRRGFELGRAFRGFEVARRWFQVDFNGSRSGDCFELGRPFRGFDVARRWFEVDLSSSGSGDRFEVGRGFRQFDVGLGGWRPAGESEVRPVRLGFDVDVSECWSSAGVGRVCRGFEVDASGPGPSGGFEVGRARLGFEVDASGS